MKLFRRLRERRKLWHELLKAKVQIEADVIRCGMLIGKYRLTTSAVEFRAELIDKQIERLRTALDQEVPALLAWIRPRPEDQPWYLNMDAKYNPPRVLDFLERVDRWLWLNVLRPVRCTPIRIWYRLVRDQPRGSLEDVQDIHAIMKDVVTAQEQLIGALDYALTPSINGKRTPVEFRDQMLRAQRSAAERRELEVRNRMRLAGAEGRLEQAIESLAHSQEDFCDLHIVSSAEVWSFLVDARKEIADLKSRGVEGDKLIAVIDTAADILYNGYRHWAGEVRVVQEKLDHIMEVSARLYREHGIQVIMEHSSGALKLLADEVRPAWAVADWQRLDAGLQSVEKILRVASYEVDRAFERAQGGTDAAVALSYPREARRKELEQGVHVEVGELGTTVDPSLAVTWQQGDHWGDRSGTEKPQ